jgi:hypothetical protein
MFNSAFQAKVDGRNLSRKDKKRLKEFRLKGNEGLSFAVGFNRRIENKKARINSGLSNPKFKMGIIKQSEFLIFFLFWASLPQ